MGRLFSRVETLLVALALLVPESLRSYAKAYEPYPAVILPAGAGKMRVRRGKVTMSRAFVTARRNGDWEEVAVDEFMAPIAQHYFGGLARNDFGFRKGKHATPADLERVAETKRWMRGKLAAQGFDPKQLRLMSQKMTIALPSGEKTSSKAVRRKTYDLD